MVAVTPDDFRERFWVRYTSYGFAEKENLAPLVAEELHRAVHSMPMAFVRQGDNFLLVGVLSLLPGSNMYVGGDGQWLGSYVPACFRCYPFRLVRAQGRDDMILCFDEDSGLVSESEGEPFFTEEDKISGQLEKILEFLGQVERSRAVMDLAVSALVEADLLCEWDLKVKDDGGERKISGLFRVDEARLNALDDDAFLRLRKTQGLPVAYAQLFSMGNIGVLQKLAGVKEQLGRQAAVPGLEVTIGDDDMIKF